MMKNIYEMLQDVCSRNKDSIFFVRQNETYADLLKKVKQRAVLLAQRFGIKKGDTVAILSGNTFCDCVPRRTCIDVRYWVATNRTHQYDETHRLQIGIGTKVYVY